MQDYSHIPDNDYMLLTPGPLSTSKRVRAAMLKDLCTWDSDYNSVVQDVRQRLCSIANLSERYTTILMQGSGSFSVESVITTAFGKVGKLLILTNGEYGKRIAQIAQINHVCINIQENRIITPEIMNEALQDSTITHVVFVHCETTTGILNPLEELCRVVKTNNKVLIIDAMSSFGGIPIDIEKLEIDFLVSSANKCIQGVPGFGFIIAKRVSLEKLKDCAKSLCLDMYAQWECMEQNNGKWRFTSPTHIVHAFREALIELEEEGGILMRYKRYKQMQEILSQGMENLGYECYIAKSYHSPIITTFCYPNFKDFTFKGMYEYLKSNGFVIYPGKLSNADTFRIGNIGDLKVNDIERLLEFIKIYTDTISK
ncbi:2-aminoethylphosphonate--pyruvate transaminase [Helicobacter muridarum]|uniref:2-aminoethylphosphonate--pyruvate transaminase n=1 Tax=Helicobacter muridarum TaxID=216 RepID=A0A099TYD0_9HELI|nr:2-aminoethylphosphonate--pyruvate transaminase [Helicobacter muridarum]TLE01673.1 2-aminoethylphosphonate--pyruvate transaminase [Helicobacter muridarum]STQ86302.1 serine-pyruvate/aspartate aminotransferase class-V [Helicobacter muridarum]